MRDDGHTSMPADLSSPRCQQCGVELRGVHVFAHVEPPIFFLQKIPARKLTRVRHENQKSFINVFLSKHTRDGASPKQHDFW